MIGADRFGMQTALLDAKAMPEVPQGEAAEAAARRRLSKLRATQSAHLEPEEDFVRGYVQGLQQALLLQQASPSDGVCPSSTGKSSDQLFEG